jgi:hypothetical protein
MEEESPIIILFWPVPSVLPRCRFPTRRGLFFALVEPKEVQHKD